MRSRPIVIAGAGIGGLTAALALSGYGFCVVVCEKTSALEATGAGVQISPNASHVLIRLGLRDALATSAIAPDAVSLCGLRAGGELARLPLPQDRDAPYWVIHRADLQAVLLDAVAARPKIELRLGVAITGFAQTDDGVAVDCAGDTIEAGALIGADGVHSTVRRQIFDHAASQPSGEVAWRGFATGATSRDVRLWMGPDAHLVAYPVAGGAQTNLVVTLPGDAEGGRLTGAAMAMRLADWPDAPLGLIAAAETLTPYPLQAVAPLASWTDGCAVLLGDAAHAMMPFAAQGAAMAIEDAAVLARCLNAETSVPAALGRYAASRMPRVQRVVAVARQSGRIYHMDGVMAFARDATIRLLGGRMLMRRQRWIYDWRDQ